MLNQALLFSSQDLAKSLTIQSRKSQAMWHWQSQEASHPPDAELPWLEGCHRGKVGARHNTYWIRHFFSSPLEREHCAPSPCSRVRPLERALDLDGSRERDLKTLFLGMGMPDKAPTGNMLVEALSEGLSIGTSVSSSLCFLSLYLHQMATMVLTNPTRRLNVLVLCRRARVTCNLFTREEENRG